MEVHIQGLRFFVALLLIVQVQKSSCDRGSSSAISGTSEERGVGEKEGRGREEFEAGIIDATGYERRNGVCRGNNLYSSRESFSACAASCTRNDDCLSFVYVFNSNITWTHPRCWLKNSDCKEIVPKESLKVYTYTKSSTGIGKTRVKNAAYRYVMVHGYCKGKTYRNMWGLRSISYCQSVCSRSSTCMTIVVRWRTVKSYYRYGRVVIKRYYTCQLRRQYCTKIVQYHDSKIYIKKDACPVCLNGGRCVKGKCHCAPGYKGKTCNVIMPCQKKPCKNGGKCVNLKGNEFKCKCLAGFSGQTCQTNIDDCAKSPCLNGGTCVDLVNKYQCYCKTGYQGLRCEFTPCRNVSCQNGGSCVVLKDLATCSCPSRYSGQFCESKIDDCKSEPCKNGGSCRTLVNGYKCECNTMYTGKQCEVNIDECDSNPCVNGGTCTDEIGGYNCTCAQGFTGKNCESKKVENCPENYCKNDGECTAKDNVYSCKCKAGYTGSKCDTAIDRTSSTVLTSSTTESPATSQVPQSTLPHKKATKERTEPQSVTSKIAQSDSTANITSEAEISETMSIPVTEEKMSPTSSISVTKTSLPTKTSSTSGAKEDISTAGTVSSLNATSPPPRVTDLPSTTKVTNPILEKASEKMLPKTEDAVAINKTGTETDSKVSVVRGGALLNKTILQDTLNATRKNESGMIVTYESNISAKANYSIVNSVPSSNVSMNPSTKSPLVKLASMTSKSSGVTAIVKPVQVSAAKTVTATTGTNLDRSSLVDSKPLDYSWEKPDKSKLDSMEALAFGDVGGLDTRHLLSNREIAAFAGGLVIALLLVGIVLIVVLLRQNHAGHNYVNAGKRYNPLSQEGDSEEDEENHGVEDFEPKNKSNNAARRSRLMKYKVGAYRPQEVVEMLSDSSGDVPEAVTSDEDEYQ